MSDGIKWTFSLGKRWFLVEIYEDGQADVLDVDQLADALGVYDDQKNRFKLLSINPWNNRRLAGIACSHTYRMPVPLSVIDDLKIADPSSAIPTPEELDAMTDSERAAALDSIHGIIARAKAPNKDRDDRLSNVDAMLKSYFFGYVNDLLPRPVPDIC